jgi:hypothetical protein
MPRSHSPAKRTAYIPRDLGLSSNSSCGYITRVRATYQGSGPGIEENTTNWPPETEKRFAVPCDEMQDGGVSAESEAVAERVRGQDENQYPRGATLFLIVLALFLSVFLICLDMV